LFQSVVRLLGVAVREAAMKRSLNVEKSPSCRMIKNRWDWESKRTFGSVKVLGSAVGKKPLTPVHSVAATIVEPSFAINLMPLFVVTISRPAAPDPGPAAH